MTRVLVTGGAGFLGSRIADALEASSDLEVARTRRSASPDRRDATVDLVDEAAVIDLLATFQPHAIVHAAGRVPGDARDLFRDNTAATVVLAEATLKACPGAALTVLGSAAEFERQADGAPIREDGPCAPSSIYGHSKWAASQYCLLARRRGLRLNLLRVFNPVDEVNGPAQVLGAFIARAVAQLDAPKPVVAMGRLDAVRDFVAVADLATLIGRLVRRGTYGEDVNVCSGVGRRVRDLVAGLVAHSGRPIEVVEAGDPPQPGRDDVVVGDPGRFLALSGLQRPQDVRDVLRRAWDRAVEGSSAR